MGITRWALRSLDLMSRIVPTGVNGAPVMAGERLDPFLHWLLHLRGMRQTPPMWQSDVDTARQHFRQDVLPLRAGFRVPVVQDLTVPGAQGALQARLYRMQISSHPQSPRAVLLYFHGGGFVIGDLDTHDDVCRLICLESGMDVLSIAYRLAPEHPFPAAVEDAIAVTRWIHVFASAHRLGLGGIAVGGDSAGANLATVAAIAMAREGVRLAGQLLFYPGTDLVTVRPSRRTFHEGLFLSEQERRWFYGHYLNGHEGNDPRISPLYEGDLSGLCPAVITTAALDMLRDEAEAYAASLSTQGVHVHLRRAAGLGHGFVNLVGTHTASCKAVADAAQALAAVVGGRQRNKL